MKIITRFICLAAILLMFDSCTISKRHFGGGYHVEWKKKWNESTADLQSPRIKEDTSIAKKQAAESDTLYAQTTPVSKSDSEKYSSKEQVEQVATHVSAAPEENEPLNEVPVELAVQDGPISSDQPLANETTDQTQVQTDHTNEEESSVYMKKRPRVEPLTWVALGFLTAAIALGLLPASLISVSLFSILFALLLLIAFINAVSSAIRVKRFPDNYKAKGLTWLVLVLCSIGFAYALIQLILIAFVPVY